MVTYEDLVLERETFSHRLLAAFSQVLDAVEIIERAFRGGNKLLICGNGGSAADSQHMAAEFVGRFERDRSGLPAIALTTDTSAITAIGNDWSYDYVFRRQLEALGRRGDVILGITTSGKSGNVLEALAHAKNMGLRTIGLVGRKGDMEAVSDVLIDIGPGRTPVVQERMLAVEHMVCELVEDKLRQDAVVGPGKRTYCFDIDGTICNTVSQYDRATPYVKRIQRVNELYDAGHTIIYYTARGSSSGVDYTELTRSQLEKWGAKHHELRLKKLQYDVWVDDKALSDGEFFGFIKE